MKSLTELILGRPFTIRGKKYREGQVVYNSTGGRIEFITYRPKTNQITYKFGSLKITGTADNNWTVLYESNPIEVTPRVV